MKGLESFEKDNYDSNVFYNASKSTMNKVPIHNLINFDDSSSIIKVSIIVPVCNVEEFLSECLDSCINQTLKEIEIICVNDGSSDNSLKILQEYAEKDKRVKVIDKDNAGYGHAMNIGMDMASGEYIGIVESDDFVELDMYEELYNIAASNNLDFIKADFHRFARDKNNNLKKDLIRVAARAPDDYNKVINPKEDTRVFHLVMQTWSGIYKRDYLIANNIRHNETPGASYQDNGFWFQTFMYAERIYFYNKPFYMNRRDNPNSSVYSKGKVYCMHEEYDHIYEILKENNELYRLYKYQYSRKKFLNFLFTYNRISDEFKYEYVFSIQKELKEAVKRFEIDWNDFDEKDKNDLKLIFKDPKEFYLNDIKKNILKKPNKEIKNLKKEVSNLKKQLNQSSDKKEENKQKNDLKNEIRHLKRQLNLVIDEKEEYTTNMYNALNPKPYLSNGGKNHKNKKVHIAFITDENYAMPTSVALTSLNHNRDKSTDYTIHILENNISEDSKSKFLSFNDENFKINIVPVNVDEKFSKLTKKDGDLHVSPSAVIKLRLPEILNNVGKVLYLDGDVIIQDDLLDLYNTDIKGYYAAVVKDIISERNPRHLKNMNIKNLYYFNSGMMLLNLTKCRSDKMTKKLLDYREKGKNHFMDQDTLNYVFDERVKYVSYKYNYLNKFHDWWGGERLSIFYGEVIPKEKIKSFKSAVVIHLGSHEKPWKYDMGYLSNLYMKYYKKSPYKDEKLILEKMPKDDTISEDFSNPESMTHRKLVDEYKKTSNEKQYYENEYNRLQGIINGNETYFMLDKRERDIYNLTHSVSFKVGRAITFIPRKIRNLIFGEVEEDF